MKILIVANGDISNYSFYKDIIKESDFIICADGGARHLLKLDVFPNIIVGDLDSISYKDKCLYQNERVEFVQFPTKKDDTDTALATELAIKMLPSEITYIGTIGTRMDHTLANINLLSNLLKKNIRGKIVNEHNEIYLINDKVQVSGEIGSVLSILPVTHMVTGIFLEGLEYPLENASISFGSSLGISNKFINEQVIVRIDSGLLLVIKSRD